MSVVRRLARTILGVAERPVDRLMTARRHPGAVTMLIYHRVGARSHSPVDLPLTVFERQLDALVSAGTVVALDDALEHLRGAPAAEPGSQQPSVVITFDDGTADWPDVVMPALVERNLPATFYVSTRFVDEQADFPGEGRPVSWAGLTEMASTGLATIGSHTHGHRVLAGCDARDAHDEIDRSIALLEDRLGTACRHFAYPKAVLGSPAAETVVRRRFASAVLAGNRANAAGATDVHRIGRHALTVADDDRSFAGKLAGGARVEGWLRELRDRRRVVSR